ncbi:hypothetical protein [Allorhodopirellula heiligendammensis]|uniref:Uncharacterized protein n=1 Tax=Allorhodopirellula heiligendammensis TaxID=2714739 RepID=A0A5C6BH29_9BACT|nr:hypothetical protein [Allorhodopirellula heiligendammensis]TWU10967.1 hypothetical protein Poly21_48730 [Allorhodopirellula heiligendammensis]|tara:strand:+ start:822 stop:1271 length:450 start_codon:yes stop_codon:yes gene_type:complete
MSKDLEDFLRQAAEMRQRKQAQWRAEAEQQREQQTRSRPSPYSNANRERVVDTATGYYDDDEDEILDERDIEMIDAVHVDEDPNQRSHHATAGDPSSSPAMAEAKIGGLSDRRRQSGPTPADALKEMIRKPDGLRQAFLLREVINRPRF